MYVCMKSLRRLVAEVAVSASLDTTIVPWSTWGHAAALFLDTNTASLEEDMINVTGSRMYGELDRRHLLLQISDCHPARVRREALDDRYNVRRDEVSDVAFLREDELQQPGSPDVPRALERVFYIFAVPGVEPRDPGNDYAIELCGDVILVTESEVRFTPMYVLIPRLATCSRTAYLESRTWVWHQMPVVLWLPLPNGLSAALYWSTAISR
ncbi:hypothetical protein PENSPDRAFT_686691 [Peniophora sp. CONT]|nr:hypothetical protein PENSPDRAFT_686691 [Peniophora sp. CONT]